MKKHTKTDWLVLITTCLAAGGIGTVIIFCFLIGFGLNTMVGKEALYIGAGLLLINLIVIWRREARLEAGMTPILRRMHTIFVWTWKIGAVLLLIALVLGICGVGFGKFWVKLPCLIGTILLPIGWLGNLITFTRRRRASEIVRAKKAES